MPRFVYQWTILNRGKIWNPHKYLTIGKWLGELQYINLKLQYSHLTCFEEIIKDGKKIKKNKRWEKILQLTKN